MSASRSDLLQDTLDEFSKELHSAFPLRNFGEFYDGRKLNDRAEKIGKRSMKKLSKKKTNLDVEDTSHLYKKLGKRIQDIILKWNLKNRRHRKHSELFLRKRIDVLFEDFNASVEKKLSVETDMDLDEFRTFIESRKEKILGFYDDFFKPGDASFQGEHKTMLEEKLDSLEKEVLERQSIHLESKFSEEARVSFEEMKTIVLIMFRQLRRKVKSQHGQVPNQLLKKRAKGILEYLEGQGDTMELDEHHQIIYCEVWGTLSGAIGYLDQLEEFLTSEEAMEWVERVDEQLHPGLEHQEDAIEEHEMQQISSGVSVAEEVDEMEMQETSIHEATSVEESVTLVDFRRSENYLDPNEPQVVVEDNHSGFVESLIEAGVGGCGSFEEPEEQHASNGGLGHESGLVPMESESRGDSEIEAVDLEDASDLNPPAIDGPYELPESIAEDTFNEADLDIDIETSDDGEPSCSLRIVQVQGSTRRAAQPSPVCPSKISIIPGKGFPMYRCKVCCSKFQTKSLLSRHGDFCRKTEKPFVCSECDKRFTWKSHLEAHHLSHTDDREKPVKCPKCKKRFATRANMLCHLRYHGSFTCKECQLSFATPKDLHNHYNLNHKEKLPFPCGYCDSRFTCMEHLKAHVISHSGERPYQCPLCESAFAKKLVFILHTRSIHRQSAEAANQLAKEAAINYFKRNLPGQPVPSLGLYAGVVSIAIKKANLKVPQDTANLPI